MKLNQMMMKRMKPWLEEHFPPLARISRQVVWAMAARGRSSRRLLRQCKDQHAGKRCFIIGNGPSLRRMDLSPLADEITFSLNRGYLYYDRIGGPCTYLVVVNKLVSEQFAAEIEVLPNTKFITWTHRHYYADRQDVIYYGGPVWRTEPRFSVDPTRDIWPGATVTYVALQLAFYMGFEQVYLIGVDHHFTTAGTPHREVVSAGGDPNHFAKDYFGKGVRWQLPDLETSEIAYHLARKTFENAGRKIIDATVGGALTIFPKADYDSLF